MMDSLNMGKIKIINWRSWSAFVAALKHVTLLGDRNIFPYANARISSRLVKVQDIKPISLYVLKQQLEIQKQLRKAFLRDYSIDILNLNGSKTDVTYEVVGEKGVWSMAPPIVEVSTVDGNIPLLLDGEHRFMLAKQMGVKIRVIWIEGVAKEVPTIAKLVDWEDVKLVDQVPQIAKKRIYRYQSLNDFPKHLVESGKVNKANFHYFFYRDLNPVCTTYIRESSDK